MVQKNMSDRVNENEFQRCVIQWTFSNSAPYKNSVEFKKSKDGNKSHDITQRSVGVISSISKVHSLAFGRVFFYSRGLQRPYIGTCTIMQEMINACIVFFKVKRIS